MGDSRRNLPTLVERIEKAMRDAIRGVPGIDKVGEAAYCEAVVEACDLVKAGAEMRLQEIDPEEEDRE